MAERYADEVAGQPAAWMPWNYRTACAPPPRLG